MVEVRQNWKSEREEWKFELVEVRKMIEVRIEKWLKWELKNG